MLFFNYVGFELPNAAGDEMKDPQKDVPFTVIRSAFMAVVLYGAPILAILLVLPISQVSSLGGFIDAIKTVFTVYGGHVGATPDATTLTGAGKVIGDITAIAFIFALMSSGATWIMGADRAQAVACYDGAGPRILGDVLEALRHAHRRERALRDHLEPVHDPRLPADEREHAAVLQRRARAGDLDDDDLVPRDLPRPLPPPPQAARRPPAVSSAFRQRGALIISALTFGWALLATAALLWPGLGQADPDSQLPSGFAAVTSGAAQHGAERLNYELSQFIPLLFFILLGVAFYVLGTSTRRQEVNVPLQPQAAGEQS